MGHIEQQTVTTSVYVSSDGRSTPLDKMQDAHLVNAFGQAAQADPERDEKMIKTLRNELLRRLALCKSQSDQ